jgi:hypothetical protein
MSKYVDEMVSETLCPIEYEQTPLNSPQTTSEKRSDGMPRERKRRWEASRSWREAIQPSPCVCVCACLSSCHTPDDARSSTSLDRRSRSRNSKTPREIPSPALACPIGGMARHSRVQQPGSVDCEPPGHDARHYRRVLTLLCSTVTNM